MITLNAVATTKHPSIADAGPDQVIILPNNTITINGSSSTDPDNNIGSYQRTKISGPSSVNIVNTNFAQTQVTSLVEGAYLFKLLIIDSGVFQQKIHYRLL